MAIETVGDLVTQLQDYMVETPLKIIDENECMSDLDVIDYDPETNVLYLVSTFLAEDENGSMFDLDDYDPVTNELYDTSLL